MDGERYQIGACCANQLPLNHNTLEGLINEIDWYKKYALSHGDSYFAGLADRLWSLIQERWEYVPPKERQYDN